MKTIFSKQAGPFLLLTFIYFIVGFLTTINGQCQGPLKVAFLSNAHNMRNFLVTLISFAFFLGYLLNSSRTGRLLNRIGYKPTLIRALFIMMGGIGCYILSTLCATTFPSIGFYWDQDFIPLGYVVFLMGSFLIGTSSAMLQVVINPYVSAFPLVGTNAVQRVNITCAINSFGTTIAPLFLSYVIFSGVPMEDVTASQLTIPFVLMVCCILVTSGITLRLPLPDLQGMRELDDKDSTDNAERKQSIWSFSNLKYGVITIFFYVGTEVSIGSNINLHAIDLGRNDFGFSPALLATLYWGGFLIGRLLSTSFKNIHPRIMLIVVTLGAISLISISIFTQHLIFLAAVGLFHSVMWSCIFNLAVEGLGKYTSRASGIFMMGVFGGAIFPVIQGIFADYLRSWQYTWIIALGCEFVILWYALRGYRRKE